jgi:hypothetical protein
MTTYTSSDSHRTQDTDGLCEEIRDVVAVASRQRCNSSKLARQRCYSEINKRGPMGHWCKTGWGLVRATENRTLSIPTITTAFDGSQPHKPRFVGDRFSLDWPTTPQSEIIAGLTGTDGASAVPPPTACFSVDGAPARTKQKHQNGNSSLSRTRQSIILRGSSSGFFGFN